jgi:hypothetical protein
MTMNNVFSRILGADYAQLPAAVRHFHEVQSGHFSGQAEVRGTGSLLARWVRKAFGFPEPAPVVAMQVRVERNAHTERWSRVFGARRFASRFATDATGQLLAEVFGPFRFYFALSVAQQRLHWHFVRWSLGPIPLPRSLGPRVVSWEGANAQGAYRFFSQAQFPIVGELLYYDGSMVPTPPQATSLLNI